MQPFNVVLLIFGIVPIFGQDLNNHAFPEDFTFGLATAAFQVEGGWSADGKGPGVWDTFIHNNPGIVQDGSNADIACDSYHKYKEDVQLLVDIGVNHYRFSLSWPRILPSGFVNNINPVAVNYYKSLIQELKFHNIEPLITMYHWDLPQNLQDAGGFESEQIIEWFADYTRLCFELFGNDVKYWMTFNEPKQVCHLGYGTPYFAPAVNSSGIGEYLCTHNLLRAHARAWHIYDEEFRHTQNGKVGIILDTEWYQPETNSTEDLMATERALQFSHGWFGHPLLLGDYPEVMKSNIERRSKQQGYSSSRLPQFTEAEIAYLNGTVDLLGVNCYTSNVVRALPNPDMTPGFSQDMEVFMYQPDDWPSTGVETFKVTPWAMRGFTSWIKNTYGNPPMVITENGVSDNDGIIEDDFRIDFLQKYLSSLRDAMEYDGVNVIGYTSWCLLDDFEWNMGYIPRFGIHYIDFDSPNRTRTAKKSAGFFKRLTETKCIVDTCS